MRAVRRTVRGHRPLTLRRRRPPSPTPEPARCSSGCRRRRRPGRRHLMAGIPLVVRPGFGLRRPKQPAPGMALAGTVEALGSDVTGFPSATGARRGLGAFAGLAVARPPSLCTRPTGWTCLRPPPCRSPHPPPCRRSTTRPGRRRPARAGDRRGRRRRLLRRPVAAAIGADVTAVASGAKAEMVRSSVPRHVVDYRTTALTPATTGGPFDLMIDIAGNRRSATCADCSPRRHTRVRRGRDRRPAHRRGPAPHRGRAPSALVSQRIVMFISARAPSAQPGDGPGAPRAGAPDPGRDLPPAEAGPRSTTFARAAYTARP